MRGTDVVQLFRQRGGNLRVREVAEHFGVSNARVTTTLRQLVNRGHLYRVSYGVYTADQEVGRRALQAQLDRMVSA
ncbi:MarR family transcriptional regulator [Mycolicibacterium sp. BiH015]|uniref:helix-turn-helix domain-containing protein n=1 Tax=Mycolicibacterium sp. BiH015 TaxID=3018808 RepID=UPI0022E5004A|nr:type IV toxin-antitoxin system AbiEi family antitoxin domain-containing protein [Mycolicibacterium sp. BiH015]MDA2893065.1 MarR family transcriptional regulator [Mycolicibacterium sp. BiH015]